MRAPALTAYLLLFTLLCTSTLAFRLACDPAKKYVYSVNSRIDGLGGQPASDKGKNQIHFFDATVRLRCSQQFNDPENTKTVYLMEFEVPKAIWRIQTGEEASSSTTDNEKDQTPPNGGAVSMDADSGKNHPMVTESDKTEEFQGFTAFTISTNGKIFHIYNAHDELNWVTTVKKSIISAIQTKIDGYSRVEHDPAGVIDAQYERRTNPDGSVTILKTFNEDNVKETIQGDKAAKYKQTVATTVSFDKNGLLTGAEKIEETIFGENSERAHEGYQRLKEAVPFEAGTQIKYDNPENRVFSTKASMKMSLIGEAEETAEDIQKFADWIQAEEKPEDDDEFFTEDAKTMQYSQDRESATTLNRRVLRFDAHQVLQSDLRPSQGVIDEAKEYRKQSITENVRFDDLLAKLEHIEDLNTFAMALEYLAADPSKYSQVIGAFENAFNRVADKYESEDPAIQTVVGFLHMAQSLLVAAGTPEAQKAFLRTFRNDELISHGLRRSLQIEHPIPELVDAIQGYEESDNRVISGNAFLVYADLASRLPGAQAKAIVDDILDRLSKIAPENEEDIIHHLYALSNAGDAAPFDILANIIYSQHASTSVKLAAIKGLKKRKANDEQVTEFIHKVAADTTLPAVVRAAALIAQTAREETMQNGASMEFAQEYLFRDDVPEVVKKALVNYIFEVGSNEGGELLLKYFNSKDSQQVSIDDDGAQTLISLDDVKGVFRSANWENQLSCYDGGSVELCIRDQDMYNYVTRQGDLSNFQSRGYSFERLIGAESMNAYIGSVTYVGTNHTCSDESSNLSVVAFTKNMAKARFFNNRFTAINAEAGIRMDDGKITQEGLYLEVFGSVVLNLPTLIPEAVKAELSCDEYIEHWKKDYPSAVDRKFEVGISFVTVTFGVNIGASIQLGSKICLGRKMDLSVQPKFSLGVSASAGIGFGFASGTVRVSTTLNYKIIPKIGVKDCYLLCAQLDHELDTIRMDIGVDLRALWWSSSENIFRVDIPAARGTIFQVCKDLSAVFEQGVQKLAPSEKLRAGDKLFSADRSFKISLASNGNIEFSKLKDDDEHYEIYSTITPWTRPSGDVYAQLVDGALKVYEQGNEKPLWSSSNTVAGSAPYKLVLGNDGNLVVSDSNGKTIWSSNTAVTRTIDRDYINTLAEGEPSESYKFGCWKGQCYRYCGNFADRGHWCYTGPSWGKPYVCQSDDDCSGDRQLNCAGNCSN